MTIEECIAAFGQEVAQQDAAIWVLIALGVALVLAALYLLLFRPGTKFQNMLILILVGGAFVIVPRSGHLPGFGGSISKPEITTSFLQTTIRAGCNQRFYARASDVPQAVPAEVIQVPAGDPSLATDLANLADEKSFVWLFYQTDRKADADQLAKKLTDAGITVSAAADDFSQVMNRQIPGTTRIIFSDASAERLASAIGQTADEMEHDEVIVQGPYQSISRGPIQLQLY